MAWGLGLLPGLQALKFGVRCLGFKGGAALGRSQNRPRAKGSGRGVPGQTTRTAVAKTTASKPAATARNATEAARGTETGKEPEATEEKEGALSYCRNEKGSGQHENQMVLNTA